MQARIGTQSGIGGIRRRTTHLAVALGLAAVGLGAGTLLYRSYEADLARERAVQFAGPSCLQASIDAAIARAPTGAEITGNIESGGLVRLDDNGHFRCTVDVHVSSRDHVSKYRYVLTVGRPSPTRITAVEQI